MVSVLGKRGMCSLSFAIILIRFCFFFAVYSCFAVPPGLVAAGTRTESPERARSASLRLPHRV